MAKIQDFLNKLRASSLNPVMRMGGFIGWYLTVMYICEQSLRFYRDDSMLASVNITFLLAAVASAAVIALVLMLLDIEGILSDRLLRWLPGVFMAESGVALSLANASTMTAFAAAAGAASALGALAVVTGLLRVKVGRRIKVISFGLAIGGIMRLIAILLIGSSVTKSGLTAAAITVGVIAALSVHSDGYTSLHTPMVTLAEAAPSTMLRKIPLAFITLFICSAAFYFVNSHVSTAAAGIIAETPSVYAIAASLGFIIAAAASGLTVRMPMTPMLFVFAAGLSTVAAVLAGLPYMTAAEAVVFAFVSYAALACAKACFYMMVVLFSLDRPHPLFYAFFGYVVAIAGQFSGLFLDQHITLPSLRSYMLISLLLMPVGGAMIVGSMQRGGFTQAQLAHRHNVRAAILRRSGELGLSERERDMTESIVLYGCGVDELSDKMLFSRNTVRVLLRSMLSKFGISDIDDLREYFDRITASDEKFHEEVLAAEADRRAADREERRQKRENRTEPTVDIKSALSRLPFGRQSAPADGTMEVTIGGSDYDIDDADIVDGSEQPVSAESEVYPDAEFVESAADEKTVEETTDESEEETQEDFEKDSEEYPDGSDEESDDDSDEDIDPFDEYYAQEFNS